MIALLLALLAAAADEPAPLSLKVGEKLSICKTGTLECPAVNPICDDTSIVTAEDGADGLAFMGLKPGTTLCSAGNSAGARRVYRVTVK